MDAARFANAFAADQIRLKNWGPSKVYAALRQVHGLAGNLASEALAEVGEDEVNKAAFRSAKILASGPVRNRPAEGDCRPFEERLQL